jgi:hypothetical protein
MKLLTSINPVIYVNHNNINNNYTKQQLKPTFIKNILKVNTNKNTFNSYTIYNIPSSIGHNTKYLKNILNTNLHINIPLSLSKINYVYTYEVYSSKNFNIYKKLPKTLKIKAPNKVNIKGVLVVNITNNPTLYKTHQNLTKIKYNFYAFKKNY